MTNSITQKIVTTVDLLHISGSFVGFFGFLWLMKKLAVFFGFCWVFGISFLIRLEWYFLVFGKHWGCSPKKSQKIPVATPKSVNWDWVFLGFFGFFKFPNWDWVFLGFLGLGYFGFFWDFLGFFGFFKFPNWDWVFLGLGFFGIFWVF